MLGLSCFMSFFSLEFEAIIWNYKIVIIQRAQNDTFVDQIQSTGKH